MKRLTLAIALLLPGVGVACYNDRDTLGFELRNKPDLQRALTGRFDRYPMLYYSMRVDRLRAKNKLTPDDYDDLAVALARQGKGGEALKAIQEKGKVPNLTAMDKYRFYANRGTIRAVNWLSQSATHPLPLSELDGATRDVAQAIQINPKGHFGREGVQLEVLRWIISYKKDPAKTSTLGSWLQKHMASDVDVPVSLSGLIMLGAAWEMPDVALAISAYFVETQDGAGTAVLALDRYQELVGEGKKPLANGREEEELVDMANFEKHRAGPSGEPSVDESFKNLREEADTWHAAKTDFMMERLKQGRHPDTDPNFWSGWVDKPMPHLWAARNTRSYAYLYAALGVGAAIVAAMVAAIVFVVRRFAKRRRLAIR